MFCIIEINFYIWIPNRSTSHELKIKYTKGIQCLYSCVLSLRLKLSPIDYKCASHISNTPIPQHINQYPLKSTSFDTILTIL